MNVLDKRDVRNRYPVLAFSLLVFLAGSVSGESHKLPAFVAKCETGEVHRYDKILGYGTGEVVSDGWSSDGFPEWTFEYRGGNTLIVNGNPIPAEIAPTSVVASSTYAGGLNINQWSYSINIVAGAAVGTNIKSNSPQSGSISVRAWNMECQITLSS